MCMWIYPYFFIWIHANSWRIVLHLSFSYLARCLAHSKDLLGKIRYSLQELSVRGRQKPSWAFVVPLLSSRSRPWSNSDGGVLSETEEGLPLLDHLDSPSLALNSHPFSHRGVDCGEQSSLSHLRLKILVFFNAFLTGPVPNHLRSRLIALLV